MHGHGAGAGTAGGGIVTCDLYDSVRHQQISAIYHKCYLDES